LLSAADCINFAGVAKANRREQLSNCVSAAVTATPTETVNRVHPDMAKASAAINMSTVRVAGAMAHELNNPLQGLLSAITAAAAETGNDDRLAPRLRQMQGGVHRLTRAIRSFAALYERLPREPEFVNVSAFQQCVADALRDMGCAISDPATSLERVRCHSTELSALTAEVLRSLLGAEVSLQSVAEEREATTVVAFTRSGEVRGSRAVRPFDERDGLSGIPVVLDEVARLAGGHVELIWEDDRIVGVALVLINECRG
jgi:signal transduction histidine kinase